jgi:hypothetical protein
MVNAYPKRRWCQFRLSTILLMTLMLGWSALMILHTEGSPAPIYVYDELDWEHKPDTDWEVIGGVLAPPRRHAVEWQSKYFYAGYPFHWAIFYGSPSPREVIDNLFVDEHHETPVSFRSILIADIGFWAALTMAFAILREWLLRRPGTRPYGWAKFNRLRLTVAIAVTILMCAANFCRRTERAVAVHSTPNHSDNVYGEAVIIGRGWPFIYEYDSPISLPTGLLPPVDIDTSLNWPAIAADLIAICLVLLCADAVYSFAIQRRSAAAKAS